jgi:hypothetical protein
MKKDNWLKTIVAGVVIACLAMPLSAMGETVKMTPMVKPTAKQATLQKKRSALHEQKRSLMKERAALAKQGDIVALKKNSDQLDALDEQLSPARKRGGKI